MEATQELTLTEIDRRVAEIAGIAIEPKPEGCCSWMRHDDHIGQWRSWRPTHSWNDAMMAVDAVGGRSFIQFLPYRPLDICVAMLRANGSLG